MSGVCIRGTALILFLMLVGFTGLIVQHALVIHHATRIAFCAIRFDCGCGVGEVLACQKIMENTCLILLDGMIFVYWRRVARITLPQLKRRGRKCVPSETDVRC
jgi:hypothetical protein